MRRRKGRGWWRSRRGGCCVGVCVDVDVDCELCGCVDVNVNVLCVGVYIFDGCWWSFCAYLCMSRDEHSKKQECKGKTTARGSRATERDTSHTERSHQGN